MSEHADKHPEEKDEELEALLKKLVPSPLHVDLIAELHRDQERIQWDRDLRPARLPWRRLVSLSLVSALLMAGFGYLQFGGQLVGTTAPVAEHTVAAVPPAPAVPASGLETQFIPVSSHGYLLNASSGGVVQTDEGPRQRLNLEFEDAYHWHDPSSGTNVRLFRPRSEEVFVPLQTD